MWVGAFCPPVFLGNRGKLRCFSCESEQEVSLDGFMLVYSRRCSLLYSAKRRPPVEVVACGRLRLCRYFAVVVTAVCC